MAGASDIDYPVGFATLTRHLRETDVPVAARGADLCAAAVLFAVDHLHPRTMAAIATRRLASSDGAVSPALCEVAASTDPDRDPHIRAAFATVLSECGLSRSADDGWGILARVGVRHARETATGIVTGAVDPIEGAIAISNCFADFLPDQERRRLESPSEPPPLERSRAFEPFVEFMQVDEHLYQAGVNVNEWNDRLAYAPANVMSADEKATALARLRARYIALARRCLDTSPAA